MTILAHAFGARYDLPIPLPLFILGGGLVVVVSFVLLPGRAAVAPGAANQVLDAAPRASEDPAGDRVAIRWSPALGVLGLAALVFVAWAGLIGSQEIAENVVPTVVWLLVWILVPLTCGLAGDWTAAINPFAFLASLANRPSLRRALLGSEAPLTWPRWLGWWPAVALFFAVACGELVFNATMTVPRNTAIALIAYAVLNLLAGLLFGAEWLARGELFRVLFSTWGRLGYFRFGGAGRRGFGGGLDTPFDASVSRITFVLLLLISVNFDGLLGTPSWTHLVTNGTFDASTARLEAFEVATFLVLAAAIALVFGAFAVGSMRMGRVAVRPARGLAELLPSLMPIAFGYLLVHNLQYLVINTQLMAPLIGNPVGQDWWPLHLPYPFNDDYELNRTTPPTSFYWYVAVAVIIAVHVIAVVIARRHLTRDRSETDETSAVRPSLAVGSTAANKRRSEYPWLVAMVGYTMVSLWLIAQPLVKEKSAAPEPTAAQTNSSQVSSQ